MRDLLAHKMGVPGYFGVLLVGYPTTTTRKEIVQRIRFMPPVKPFRTGFIYNNFMYALGGYAAELLAERSATWEQLNQVNIFDPAGMTSSGYVDQTPAPLVIALPYVYVNGSAYQVDTEVARSVAPLGPAGSIYSTAEDMARWMQLHLAVISRYDGSGRPTIPYPGSLRLSAQAGRRVWETYQAQMPEPEINPPLVRPAFPVDDVPVSYAMGWVRGIYRGHRKLYHTGGISTYISLVQLLPDARAGIFLSSSGPGARAGGVVNRIVAAYISDKLLGEAPWINTTTACSFPAPWAAITRNHGDALTAEVSTPEPAVPTIGTPLKVDDSAGLDPLEAFPGRYGHLGFGTIEVYVVDGVLYARFGRFGRLRLDPTPVVGFFHGRYLDKLWYLSNQDNSPTSLKMQFVSLEGGKTQELLCPMDPMSVSTFKRGLDSGLIPQYQRGDPGLYMCQGTLSSSAGVAHSHQLTAHVLIVFAISTLLGVCQTALDHRI